MSNIAAYGYGIRTRLRGAGPASYGYDGYLAVLLAIKRETSTRQMVALSIGENPAGASSGTDLTQESAKPLLAGISTEQVFDSQTVLHANDGESTIGANEGISRETSLSGASDGSTPQGESTDDVLVGETTDPAEPVE